MSSPRWHRVGPVWSPSAVWLNTTSSSTSRPAACRASTMALNSATWPPGLPGAHRGRVAGVRREVADRVVAPVVGQATVREEGLGDVLVHREQFDGGDTQMEQVGDGRLVAEPGVGAAQLRRDVRVGRGEPLDVDLVDDRVGVPAGRDGLGGPLVGRVHHQAARHVGGRVEGARRVGVVGARGRAPPARTGRRR